MRKYHLSYDVISDNNNFDNDFVEKHLTVRETILAILKKMGVQSVSSPCESTIVFTYPNRDFNRTTFATKASKYIYFSLCLVAKHDSEDFEKINKSPNIDDEILQDLWDSIEY
ncbi:hypothetical protein [Chryseobacterium sp.]|uniref:hypothetical protein n=1 Tax=Chryseobacterium sp. TaxID=1871047 RepID=UPI002896534A|nr:hypothetical protein [Chryseobacterium sp.]